MRSVIIIGAGGHGKVIADIIQRSGDRIIGFLDDNMKAGDSFIGVPILGDTEKYEEYNNAEFVIAVGNAAIREKISEKLSDVRWYTAIHPFAVVSNIDIEIGEGTVVMANAVINSGSRIGKHCIINSGAVVEHDNVIEDFVHVSVGAKLAGTVHIGKSTWVGIGATVSNNIDICSGCTIGAGAVVVNNVNEAGTYVGVPARRKDMEKKERNTKFIGGWE